jgi:hypothetical protein
MAGERHGMCELVLKRAQATTESEAPFEQIATVTQTATYTGGYKYL